MGNKISYTDENGHLLGSNKIKEFQIVINQVSNQILWHKKEAPFDTEYYQKGKGFKDNKNPFKKLTLIECQQILKRLEYGMEVLKKYKKKNYLNKLRVFKYRNYRLIDI